MKINTRPFMDVNMDRSLTAKVVFVYRKSFNDGNPFNWNINAILEFYNESCLIYINNIFLIMVL